jgi:uncharacterized repeat protein (TIGR03803 family)
MSSDRRGMQPALAFVGILTLMGGTSNEVVGKEKILHAFGATGDGINPTAGLIFGKNGNLYGTTGGGGSYGSGTVFSLSPNRTETLLYSFKGGTDGLHPNVNLLLDDKGNIYGATQAGGNVNSEFCAYGCGTVFKLAPDGTETILYAFCSETNCADGYYPQSALIEDKDGNLYGTTYGGGTYYDAGVIFEIPATGGETVIHDFGYYDEIPDKDGNFYGTTEYGGYADYCTQEFIEGCGTVFKLSPNGTETVLYRFDGSNDGAYPPDALIRDNHGNLYGTTWEGTGTDPYGIVFKITPEGTEKILHAFNDIQSNKDGLYPYGSLVMDSLGALYGTTNQGGIYDEGTVFKLDP